MTDLCFYDTEATDADKRHGQITQFGGIRTDLNFQKLADLNIRVRPLPWIVPTPEALQVTGMDIWQLFCEEAISEFDAAGEIDRFLNPGWAGERIFVTYYGIPFDDELIRTTLLRSLRHPYVTSGKNSTRVDMLDVVRLTHHFQPGTLETVFDEERGKLTWRLEKICPANGIALRAHDAYADAEGLMDLTRLVRERAPWAWNLAVANGNPARVDPMLKNAGEGDAPLFLFTHFGEPAVVPCFPLATDDKRKHVLVDLRAESYPTDIESALGVFNKAGTPYPQVKSNLSPLFVPPDMVSRIHAFDFPELSEKIRRIKSDPAICRVAEELVSRRDYKAKENPTSEERIYDGFVRSEDKEPIRRFLDTRKWSERAAMRFTDDRIDDFAARICLDAGRSGEAVYPSHVWDDLEHRAAEAISRPFAGADARWATIASVLEAGTASDDWREWATGYYGLDVDWGDEAEVHDEPLPELREPQFNLPF
jgi:exodeoxyribonuclease-1